VSLDVVADVAQVRSVVRSARQSGRRIGFVPTMGALHAGHRSLLEAARRECDVVLASIFVNPTQFAPNEDLSKYPRTLEADLTMCRETGVDVVYHPTVETMYPPGSTTAVEVDGLSAVLDGRYRPTHFRGVTTVVTQLFNIVAPDVAFFGQKDYQQQTIIRRMCRDLHLPVEIRVCPTVREPDGLAMSSRNVFLSQAERRSALALSRSLKLAREMLRAGETRLDPIRRAMYDLLSGTPLVNVDYATLIHPDSLEELEVAEAKVVAIVAAKVGATRLIDNEIIVL